MNAEDWLKVIAKRPKDPLPKRAFADWLEERDQLPLARAWRLIAEKGWRPLRYGAMYLPRRQYSYDWRYDRRPSGSTEAQQLPKSIFLKLKAPPDAKIHTSRPYREFKSIADAYKELARVLAQREERNARRRAKNRS